MAIYHCSVKVIGRNEGKSAIAAAAYRAGVELTSMYDGLKRDYTGKGFIEYNEIMLPENAPMSFMDRSNLWNSVEMVEKTNDAQLAREVEVSLPKEMTREEQLDVVHSFVASNFVAQGMCADIAIHNPPVRDDRGVPLDENGNRTKDKEKFVYNNPHAHILLTVRPLDENGKWEAKSKIEYLCVKDGEEKGFTAEEYKKAQADGWEKQYKYKDGKKTIWLTSKQGEERELKRVNRSPKTSKFGRKNPVVEYWNSEDRVLEWRKNWEQVVNQKFKEIGSDISIDSRSFKDMGIENMPTIHMGPSATNMERKADRLIREGKSEAEVERSDIGEINRDIKEYNSLLARIVAKVTDVAKEVFAGIIPHNEVEDLVDEIEENNYIFRRLEPNDEDRKYFTNDELRKMQEPENVRAFIKRHKIKSYDSCNKLYEESKKNLDIYCDYALTRNQKIERLQDMAKTYSMMQDVRGAYDESQKKSGLSKVIFDTTHKEEIEKFEKVRNKFFKLLGDEELKPFKWNEEVSSLQKEIEDIETKIQDAKECLVYTKEIDRTRRMGGQPASIRKSLEDNKEKVENANRGREAKTLERKKVKVEEL